MDSMDRGDALRVLESLFDRATFVSFARMEAATGLEHGQILVLKPELQERLRAGDRSVSLTSMVHLRRPGFFLEVG